MKKLNQLIEQALNHHPDRSIELMAGPAPLSSNEIAHYQDAELFSLMSRRIFRAGLKHSVVDAKWPGFEKVFFGFVPEKVMLMSDEQLEDLMANPDIIRHFGKIKATRQNAFMISDLAHKHGSFAKLVGEWPVSDIVGLWALLKKEGAQLGGNSAAYFLRMAGKDTFVLTDDVVTALIAQGVVTKRPTGKRDLQLVQDAFNQWAAEGDYALCQISRILAHSIG